MNKYLIEILKIRTSVILPGLGGFMIANTKTGKIIINKHLKFDDGVLATFIADKEKIDKTEAKNMVSKFVREIEAVLGKGESYDIYQFGKITKGEKGDLIFEMDESIKKESNAPISTKPEPKKEDKPKNSYVPPVVEKTVEEGVEKPKKEEVTKAEVKKENAKNTYIPPVKKEEVKEEKVETPKKATKEEQAKEKKDAKALEAKKKEEAKVLAANKKKEEKELAAKKKAEAKEKAALLKKEKAEKKKNKKPAAVVLDKDGKPKKKKRKIVPLIIILLLVGGVGTGGYLYQDKIKEMLGINKTTAEHSEDETKEEHNDHNSDAVVEHSEEEATEGHTTEEHIEAENENTDSEENIDDVEEVAQETEEIVEEQVEEAVVEEVHSTVSTSVNGSYHIIGGGFSEESNANNYASKNNGTVLGRFDNLYLVALKSYDSMSDAKADLSNMKSVSSGAWIFKYSK